MKQAKGQTGGFLSMLLGTLGASLVGNVLARKGINIEGKGRGINRVGEGRRIVRAVYGRYLKKRVFNAASSFN